MIININIFSKYTIFLLIIFIYFIVPLYSEVIDPEKINSTIIQTEVLDPTQEEQNGLILKVIFGKEFKTSYENGSARYYDLEYDKENKVINCHVTSRDGRSDYSWKIKDLDNSGNYKVEGIRRGKVTYNSERKPVKLEYKKSRVNENIEDNFIDHGKFFIPSMILKPGDEWTYYFTDIMDFSEKETSDPAYYSIEIKAVFKLEGYKDFEKTRAAVITSEISIRKVFVLLYNKKDLQVKGGTLIFDITSVNQLLIDRKTGKPLFCITGILKKAKGSLHDNWGNTPEEAEKNVLNNYEGFINANETNYTIYYIRYSDKSKNIVKDKEE